MSGALTRWISSGIRIYGRGRRATCVVTSRCKSALTQEQHSVTEEPRKIVVPVVVPDKIQAAVLKEFSGPLHIENIEPPKILQQKEVLIDIHYCALNGADLLLSEDSYIFRAGLPMILGYEIAGELLEVGEEAAKAGYKVGDKVIALNKERYGGFAEQCVAELGDIWKVPSTLKLMDAACLLDGYSTALIGLDKLASIQEDDIVILNVGLGGVGLAAVDLATNVFRSKVIGVCSSESRATLVRAKGAFASLKYNDKKLLKQIESVAAEQNMKNIFNSSGGEDLKKVLNRFMDVYKPDAASKILLRDDKFTVVVQKLSEEGRLIVAGLAAAKIDQIADIQKDSLSVTEVSLLDYRRKNHEVYRQAGDEILEFYEEGLIKPSYSLIAGLHRINNAMRFMTEMKSSGKVIIDLKDKDVEKETVPKD